MNGDFNSSSLQELKCLLHAHREAVAKCPSCNHFFCRECVVEHAGRMLCKRCLDEASSEDESTKSSLRGWLMAGLSICISFIITLSVFYLLGKTLLSIPEDFHASPSEYISDSLDE